MACSHCTGRYLKGMVDVSGKEDLYRFGKELVKRGGRGMLVSGGCSPDGAVDFPDHTFQEIRRLKEETSLLINLHCGLVDGKTADSISRALVDRVSFDLVYHDPTIESVLNLQRKREDYVSTMELLIEKGLKVSPHILAGLDHGKLSWEKDAVKMIAKMGDRIDEVILIVLIPTKGTPFGELPVPSEEEVLDLASFMRKNLDCRLVLGCMRPKGFHAIETGVLDIGFDGIVLPSKRTAAWIGERGFPVEDRNICCCF
jgi:uncharacterized radical SAM superfamily protein